MINLSTLSKESKIALAIASIGLIIGHAGCPEKLHLFEFSFRMHLFFFVAGFAIPNNLYGNMWLFVKKITIPLYLTFVAWSLIFLFPHNIFMELGIYRTHYNFSEYLSQFVKILGMLSSEQLLGSFHILKEILFISIMGLFVIEINNRYRKDLIIYMSILISLIIATILSYYNIHIFIINEKIFMGLSAFLCGYVYKKIDTRKFDLLITLIGFSICYIFSALYPIANGYYAISTNITPSMIIAITGSISTYSFAKILVQRKLLISNILVKLGESSFYIMALHFFAFKLVSLIALMYFGSSGELYEFPTLASLNNSAWWVAYSLSGILLPFIIYRLVTKVIIKK